MPSLSSSNNPWIDDAVAGISGQNIYVDPDVSGGPALTDALTSVVPGDGSIAVVVLPADAARDTPYNTYILEQLTAGASQQTVIVAIGDDLQAASATIDDALRIANENESSGGSLQDQLLETVTEISAETPTSSGDDTLVANPVIPFVIGGVVLVAAAVTAVGLIARRRRRTTPTSTDPVPAGIRLRVNRLRELRADYAAVPGSPVAAETAAGIDALASHVEQLFIRLDAKAGEDQSVLAEAEYSDKLARLVAALDRDYLLDLLTRPDLWDAPDERIAEVREALSSVTTQIVDNIKQVNARKGLLFQVSLDSLIGRSELRDWERQFKQSSGD
ncbi:hypothetical protein JOF42_000620 [Microbacterium phyllosphaerae]|uniref:TPM domain-containing protein n=1 Tax=Microbacterium phyllosphaerae TaxID=124798 RepID=A0ABS4WLP6_9MICO|nr:hypothetical protein [Microbacterium phyllosphaerae]MBP2377125.1 hypothetical protein [Microbacterium phyllosphaerae]